MDVIDNIYVPRFCRSISARILTISEEQKVAVYGGMILGDVFQTLEDEEKTETNKYSVKLKGIFAATSGQCNHEKSEKNDGRRHLDLAHDGRYWSDATVYYEISDGFELIVQKAIEAAVWYWTQNSPARFVYSTTASDRLVFTPVSDDSCVSYVGKIGGQQTVAIDADGSCNYGSVAHELGHALGFYHEHARPDRLDYITINEANIWEGYTANFDVIEEQYGEHDYDYGSIMHYPKQGFTSGGDTIDVIDSKFETFLDTYPNDLPLEYLGQRAFLSTIDKQMGYTYLYNCVDSSGSGWDTGPWGGCEPQCPVSYRQRMVFCKKSGYCVDDSICDESTRPASRQACEITPGTNITFEDTSLVKKGFPMQNVPYYDQFDWILWSGYPAETALYGKTLLGDRESGPGTDADGNEEGHYLWFTSQAPTQVNDEAWYESPIVATTNAQKCEITFAFLIAGKEGTLRIDAVPCSDCTQKEALWSSSAISSSWDTKTLEIPEFPDDDVRIRFVAHRGSKWYGEIGIDNIYFSEGCVRSEIPDLNTTSLPMSSPYILDPDCIYYPAEEFEWTLRNIMIVTGCGLIFLLILICIIECILRVRKWYTVKKGMKDSADGDSHHKARLHLKKQHICTLFGNAFSGVYERAKRVKRVIGAHRRKVTQKDDYAIQSQGGFVHSNKSKKSLAMIKRQSSHELDGKLDEKDSLLLLFFGKKNFKFRAFAERSGVLDRLDQFAKIFTCGKVQQTALHVEDVRITATRDRRSQRHVSSKKGMAINAAPASKQNGDPTPNV